MPIFYIPSSERFCSVCIPWDSKELLQSTELLQFSVWRLIINCPQKLQSCSSNPSLTYSGMIWQHLLSLDTMPESQGKPCTQLVNPSICYNHRLCTSGKKHFCFCKNFFSRQAPLRCLASPSSLPLAEDMIKSKSRQVITLYNRQDWHFQNHFHVDGNDIA